MDKKIDLIMSSVQQFCQEGYLLPKERQTLFDLAELHDIDKVELENVLAVELDKVRKGRLDSLYKAAKQPDAALSNNVEMFQQSRRQFPDILKLGTLKLKLNQEVTAPAFVPIKGMTGLCIVHKDNAELACNIIQNVAMRLLLSLPRSLTQVTIVDFTSMGADYIGLSGIDSHLLKVIDDEKQVQPFLQTISKESASFNFNGLGSSFADISEYNRANRSKARPYQLIILSDFQIITDKIILSEIKKINKLASKTGVFFLFSVDSQSLAENKELFDVFKVRQEDHPNICIVDTVNNELRTDNSDEVAFFNNAYDFEIDQDLLFNTNTIQQLNHEYDPNTYPLAITHDEDGDYCIESLNVVIGKQINGKAYTLALQNIHDNVFVISQDGETLARMGKTMLQSIVTGYKQSELDYLFCNCGFIPKQLSATNIICNIHANKLCYIQTFLERIKQETETRKGLFQEAHVSTYEDYRNMVETPLPRLICFMGSLEMLLDSESLSAVNTLMLLDNLLDQAGLYGIHFFLFGKILGSYELNHIILTKFLKENSLSHLPLEKQEVARTYLSEDSSKTIYRSDTDTILSRLSQIGVFIKDVVDNYPDSASNYSLLKELFDEQFIIKDGKVELRDKTTVNLANLQGLNDFDASVSDKLLANLLKLNLKEYVRFKLFGSLNEEEITRIGFFVSEDEINHQSQKNGGILYDVKQSSSTKYELLPIDDKKWNDAIKSFAVEEGLVTQPKVFVDLYDTYPESYRDVNANNIADSCFTCDIPIGIPRCFATQFSSLGHDNVMIVGDDPDGEMSILTSVHTAMNRSGRLSSLCVFDALGCNLTKLPDVEIHSNLNMLPLVENGILCMLHMDALDTIYINKLYTIIEEAEEKNVQVLLFAKNDICTGGFGLTDTSFMTKIALCHAPEGFISPVHFITNDEISLPALSMQALSEQISTEGGMDVKSMWLFNY